MLQFFYLYILGYLYYAAKAGINELSTPVYEADIGDHCLTFYFATIGHYVDGDAMRVMLEYDDKEIGDHRQTLQKIQKLSKHWSLYQINIAPDHNFKVCVNFNFFLFLPDD